MKKNRRSAKARFLTRARQRDAQLAAERRRAARRKRGAAIGAPWETRPATRTRQLSASPSNPPVTILAPEILNVVLNPEEFIGTFERVEQLMRKQRVPRIDFAATKSVSADAILTMVAIGVRLARKYNVEIKIGKPTDPALIEMFESSGWDSLFGNVPSTKDTGMIRRRMNKKVEARIAQELIIFATQTLFQERRREFASFSTFVECMGNTFEHSAKNAEGKELWWASVFCNPETKRAQCTFVDTGIGIFESVVFKGLVKKITGEFRKAISRPEVLRDLLERKIGSRTGESYRNRGMPQIYIDAKEGKIKNLVIITDRVYADIDRNEFRSISKTFRGTFYYWEFST